MSTAGGMPRASVPVMTGMRASHGVLSATPGHRDHDLIGGPAAMPGGRADSALRRCCDVPGAAVPLAVEFSVRYRGEVAVVSLRGELNAAGAWLVRTRLLRGRPWARCVVDLTHLDIIGGTGLSVLVRHCKEIRRRGGGYALAGPQPAVRSILAVTGLLTWFEVHDTVEEAVTGTSGQRGPARSQ